MTEKTKEQLRDDWLDTIQLREKVLAWAKYSGFSASELVSRKAEHDIEWHYGKKRLEDND
jgi:hypothetical protein